MFTELVVYWAQRRLSSAFTEHSVHCDRRLQSVHRLHKANDVWEVKHICCRTSIGRRAEVELCSRWTLAYCRWLYTSLHELSTGWFAIYVPVVYYPAVYVPGVYLQPMSSLCVETSTILFSSNDLVTMQLQCIKWYALVNGRFSLENFLCALHTVQSGHRGKRQWC